jgi:hypothetical protein
MVPFSRSHGIVPAPENAEGGRRLFNAWVDIMVEGYNPMIFAGSP